MHKWYRGVYSNLRYKENHTVSKFHSLEREIDNEITQEVTRLYMTYMKEEIDDTISRVCAYVFE